jgi:hypothetical protein
MAGLAALPLTASAADAAPIGSASASALQVEISLAPLAASLNGTGALGQLHDAFETLKTSLCGAAAPTCNLGLSIPKTLPDFLKLDVAQARVDPTTFNAAGTDVVSGKSFSSPIATSWAALDANISALQTLLTNLINQGTSALAAGNLTALAGLLTNQGGALTANVPALGTAKFSLLGTVAAALPGTPADTATAVQITGLPDAATKGLNVTVDPFSAYAANAAALAARPDLKLAGPQVSASNTLVGVALPDLITPNVDPAALQPLALELHTLIDAITKAIADPSHAGSILSAAPVPGPVHDALKTLGDAINASLLGPVAGVVNPVTSNDMGALKLFDAQLSAAADALKKAIDALAALRLPDVGNLVRSADDIATAKTEPVAGGGVASKATSTLGSLTILPIGDSLASAISAATGLAGVSSGITKDTALLSVKGITASALASVGPGGSQSGSAGLRTVSVLGQSLDLQNLGPNLALGPGQELNHVFAFPGLGAGGGTGYVTLDITRGVPQVVADSATYREVHMAALQLRLYNGKLACSTPDPANCSDPLALPGGAKPATAARVSSGTAATTHDGVQQLGLDGDLVRLAAPQAQAAASMNPISCDGKGSPTCPTVNKFDTPGNPVTPSLTSLPSTGIFGGGALPAGFALIAVAISLRLVPGLRSRLRRMR